MSDKNEEGESGGEAKNKNLSSTANVITTDIKPKQGKRRSRAQSAAVEIEKEAGASAWTSQGGCTAVASPSTQSTDSSSTSSSTSSIDSEALQQKLSSSTTVTALGRVRLVEANEQTVRLRHDSLTAAMALTATNVNYGRRKSTIGGLGFDTHTPIMSRKRSIRSHMSELEAMAAERRKLTAASLSLRKNSRVIRSARIDLLSG
jgi:hypothetical protein